MLRNNTLDYLFNHGAIVMVAVQYGDILVGRDLTGGVYTGINLEVWRDGMLAGILESSLAHDWNVDPWSTELAYKIAIDQLGNMYVGAASSNNSNSGPNVYKWDSGGDFIGKSGLVQLPNWSPWGDDIGRVCTILPCPDGGGFAAGLMTNIIGMLVDRTGDIYALRANLVKGGVVGGLYVGTGDPIANVYALAKYNAVGEPLEKYEVAFDWANNPASGINQQDIESGDITCNGRYCVVVCGDTHTAPVQIGTGQIIKYELANPVAQVLYSATNVFGGGNFTGQALSIHPSTNEIVCLHSNEGPIIKIALDGATTELISVPGLAGAASLEYYLDPRRVIIGTFGVSGADFYLVDLTKPDGAGLEWDAVSVQQLFTSVDGRPNVVGVYNVRECEAAISSVFGTVIGAT